jgi:two-component system, response regulator RegA
MEMFPSEVVITEFRIGNESLLQFLPELTRRVPLERFIVVTSYPSVASAVRFTRMGVLAYMAKPVSVTAILEMLRATGQDNPREDEDGWPTLDRTIWEYLSQVHNLAGSISEAARRLGLDPRSLRRMLAKYPPPR